MKTKKVAPITFRTSQETKNQLEKIAEYHEWTVSQICEKIIRQYAEIEYENISKKEKNDGAINFIITNNQNININGKD